MRIIQPAPAPDPGGDPAQIHGAAAAGRAGRRRPGAAPGGRRQRAAGDLGGHGAHRAGAGAGALCSTAPDRSTRSARRATSRRRRCAASPGRWWCWAGWSGRRPLIRRWRAAAGTAPAPPPADSARAGRRRDRPGARRPAIAPSIGARVLSRYALVRGGRLLPAPRPGPRCDAARGAARPPGALARAVAAGARRRAGRRARRRAARHPRGARRGDARAGRSADAPALPGAPAVSSTSPSAAPSASARRPE